MISPHHFHPTNGVRPSDSLDDGEKDRAITLMRRVEAGVQANMSYCINRAVSISPDPFDPDPFDPINFYGYDGMNVFGFDMGDGYWPWNWNLFQ